MSFIFHHSIRPTLVGEARLLGRQARGPEQAPLTPDRYGAAPEQSAPAHQQLREKKAWFEKTRDNYVKELLDFKDGLTQEHMDLLRNSKQPWQEFLQKMDSLSQDTEHNASLLQEEVDHSWPVN